MSLLERIPFFTTAMNEFQFRKEVYSLSSQALETEQQFLQFLLSTEITDRNLHQSLPQTLVTQLIQFTQTEESKYVLFGRHFFGVLVGIHRYVALDQRSDISWKTQVKKTDNGSEIVAAMFDIDTATYRHELYFLFSSNVTSTSSAAARLAGHGFVQGTVTHCDSLGRRFSIESQGTSVVFRLEPIAFDQKHIYLGVLKKDKNTPVKGKSNRDTTFPLQWSFAGV